MKKTLVVNLYGGPGTGKSTGAAYIFSQLKMMGYDCELVTEFAKDKVWEENPAPFKCQFYVTGKQIFKINRVYGKVDIIITDSPILLGVEYAPSDRPCLKAAIIEEHKSYNNLEILLNRKKAYNPNGRFQTEEEAKAIDDQMKELLEDVNIHYECFDGTSEGYDKIVGRIVQCLQFQSSGDNLGVS